MMKAKLSISLKMFIGMLLGITCGIFCHQYELSTDYIKPLGDLFINLIKMVVVPLVFATLVSGAASISDTSRLGRIAFKTLSYYCITSLIALSLGLLLGNLFKVGYGLTIQNTEQAVRSVSEMNSIVDALLGIVPTNPIQAMTSGNILQVIFFSIMLGFAMSLCREKAKPVIEFFDSLSAVMIKMTLIVMWYAPIGTFALMTCTVSSYGLAALIPLIKLIVLMYAVSLLHIVLVYLPLLKYCAINLKVFSRIIAAPLLIAFSTCSSAAALSANLISTERLGVPRSISSFSIPLGNTINMDGASIYLGLVVVFAAQVFNIDLTAGDYINALFIGLLASIGSMGMPGAILIMMSVMVLQLGLPPEVIALVAGIDRIMDMARTPMNILGDAVGACVVSKSEGLLSKQEIACT